MVHLPVADIIEPSEPGLLVFLGHDLELSVPNRIRGSLGHAGAVDPPDKKRLWCEVCGEGMRCEVWWCVCMVCGLVCAG